MPTPDPLPLDSATRVDRDNPWPGLSPFEEGDRDYFFGRSTEATELARWVQRERLTVVFGKSGLGKTSLLLAGLMPILRQNDFLPIYVRLDHSDAAPALAQQIKEGLKRVMAEEHVDGRAPADGETLWEYFHREDSDFWSRRNRLLTPLFILDQFEEIFTLGRQSQERMTRVGDFLEELECLVEGHAPGKVKARFESDPDAAAPFDFDKQAAKVLLALREDFLADLEGLRERLRSIGHNRYRVRPMNGRQAMDVVLKPAAGLVDEAVAAEIVRFVSSSRQRQNVAATSDQLMVRDVEPALLSVVCRELNNRRQRLHQATITTDLLTGSKEGIIQDFYLRSLEGLDSRVRTFIENELLTGSGFRKPAALEDALKAPGVTPEVVRTLVDRRLLRQEETSGVMWIELTHDLLTAVVVASRNQRREREARETAAERERQIRKRLAVSRNVLAGVSVAFVLAVVSAVVAWRYREEARQALVEAHLQRGRATAEAVNAKQTSSRADFELACQLLNQTQKDPERACEAVAHLVRSLTTEPDNRAALLRLYSALAAKVWPLPVGHALVHLNQHIGALFSPDGQRVLAAVNPRTLCLQDPRTGQPLGKPMEHPATLVLSAQFSPDGRWVLTGTDRGLAQIWNPLSGETVGKPMRQGRYVRNVFFSPDGRRILTQSEAGPLQWWDAATQEPLDEPIQVEPSNRGTSELSSDGRWVLTYTRNEVRVWDSQTGAPFGQLIRLEEGDVACAQFSPDGRWVATGSDRGLAQVWDPASGKGVGTPLVHGRRIADVQFSPDGRWVVTSSSCARIWDPLTGSTLGETSGNDGPLASAQFSADGWKLLTTSQNGVVQVWEGATGKALPNQVQIWNSECHPMASPSGRWVVTQIPDTDIQVWEARSGGPVSALMRHPHPVLRTEFSQDERRVVTLSSSNVVTVWDVQTGQPVGPPMVHERKVITVQFSPSAKELLTVCQDNAARVWEPVTGKLVGEPMRHAQSLMSGEFSLNGRWVLTLAGDHVARVWEAKSGRLIGQPMQSNDPLERALFCADDLHVLTVSAEKSVQVWDAQSGQPVGAPIQHSRLIERGASDIDRRRVVTLSDDEMTVQMWDTQTGMPVGIPLHFGEKFSAIRFSNDGQSVLTLSSLEPIVRLWSAKSGEAIGPSIRHDDWVGSAEFSLDNQWLVTASYDQIARVWEVRSGKAVSEPMRHEQGVLNSLFSADGRSVLTGSPDRSVHVWDFNPFGSAPASRSLLEAASVLARIRLGDGEARKVISQSEAEAAREKMAGLPDNDSTDVLAKWLLSPPSSRASNPFSANNPTSWTMIPAPEGVSLDVAEDAVLRMPNHPLALCRLAAQQMRPEATNAPGGGWFYADRNSRAAIALAPKDPEVWLCRGEVLLRAGDRGREAADAFATALALAGDKVSLMPNRAKSIVARCANFSDECLRSGHFLEATQIARTGLTIDPTNVASRINQAHGHLFLGEFEKAKALYLEMKNDPTDSTVAQAALDDLDALEKEGITHPDVPRIRNLLNAKVPH